MDIRNSVASATAYLPSQRKKYQYEIDWSIIKTSFFKRNNKQNEEIFLQKDRFRVW